VSTLRPQNSVATGLFRLDVSSEIINDTDIIFFQGAQQLGGANDSTISSIKRFAFDINLDTGSLSNGGLVVTTASGAIWDTQFSGFINGNLLDMTVTGGTITGIDSTTIDPASSVRGDIAGFFFTSTAFPAFEDSIPEPGRLPDIEVPPDFVGGLVGGFSLRDENSSYTLSGSVLISGKRPEPEPTPTTGTHPPHGALQPQPPAVETRPPFISWGPWANQVTQNFVVVTPIDADNATISSGDFLANVNPAPISSMTGTFHSYQNSDHASYVGSASAGSILGVFAHLHVDFDSGAITDGRLDVDVGVTGMHTIQTWSLGFTGSVSGGVASLNSSGGSLSDLGGLVSSSIGATLGGLFTGDSATWFVGGFNLIDMLNDSNSVQGLYVIER